MRTMPTALERLPELAQNLWWSWHLEARDFFRALDETLWRETRHNPVRFLHEIAAERLVLAAADPEILRRYETVMKAFDAAIRGDKNWCAERHPAVSGCTLAFFSAEYGIHNSLPLYAGGLGVLAGDITKEASDLGIPLVGIGFMYPQGYFRQYVNPEGRQEEVYEQIDRGQVPVAPVTTADGKPIRVSLTLPDRMLQVAAWKVLIGRSVLYLLDTDLDGNAPWDRELTGRLYGGDQNARFLQEIVLGVGGVRMLRALGVKPTVWHGNEGHTALMMVERLRERLRAGVDFDRAVEEVRATTIFTTHTPVPAGNDAFPFPLVENYVSRLGEYGAVIDAYRERLYSMATHPAAWGPAFNMTALALRLSGRVNAVSRKHGEVARAMWQDLWPGLPVDQVPIASITNGVHVPTWIAGDIDRLHKRHVAEDWIERHDDPALWERVSAIPDEALWEVRRRLKAGLFRFLRDRVRQRWAASHADPGQAVALGSLLDPGALTIGFARRFATYKRAGLILRDPARLHAILTNERRPVQIIFAGKAHPADEQGKEILQSVYRAARDPAAAGRVAFLEDYDMHAAHWLTQGVDLWLNNPRAPQEASGTSGMKAGINGVPSVSILDGWWAEAAGRANGWAFGGDAEAPDADARDAAELYRLIEETIVPLYYDRDSGDIPRGWLEVVRQAIRTVTPAFSGRRMMKEYVELMYIPAALGAIGSRKS
ncbi:MAG: glycosyltransferase family 1 protein [Candidatus Eisenbacteria bacterium]|uniref:Glycosyltransferase family 1 protein n=1 Tax=Eiseniibacteriota bacterium TaxID=2212470 RepID=A0A538THT0_UNCEI|nr:MAG: glycosyltransferase family 1 protein [Candidatus Eisenbacteria bacterium]